MKEVAEGRLGVWANIVEFPFVKGSLRARVTGDAPFIESIDVEGDTPSETKERRLRGC